MPHYADHGVLERSPFASIDEEGAVLAAQPQLEAVARALHRHSHHRPHLDPLLRLRRLEYVSCSPFRVAIARVAAAPAAIAGAD